MTPDYSYNLVDVQNGSSVFFPGAAESIMEGGVRVGTEEIIPSSGIS